MRDLAEALLREDVEEGGDIETEKRCRELLRASSSEKLPSVSALLHAPTAARRKMCIALFESIGFQKIVVGGVLADIVALSIEIQFPDHPFVEVCIHLITRILLAVVVAELLGLMYGYGRDFLQKRWRVCDAVIVSYLSELNFIPGRLLNFQ